VGIYFFPSIGIILKIFIGSIIFFNNKDRGVIVKPTSYFPKTLHQDRIPPLSYLSCSFNFWYNIVFVRFYDNCTQAFSCGIS